MTAISTIRSATEDDIRPVLELVRESGRHLRREDLLAREGRHVVVLDAPDGGLAAAAVLVIEGQRGHLVMLAIARRFEGQGLEDRVIAVLEAMSSAFGARTLDVQSLRAA